MEYLNDHSGAIQAIATVILAAITITYVLLTKQASGAAKRSAEAAEEMVELTSRPVIIQKSVTPKGVSSEIISDHFEIYNAGNGPAIEVQVILLDDSKKALDSIREGFLRAGDLPMKFCPILSPTLKNFYIVSEYQGISSRSPQPTWYQTWLPCKLGVSGRVIAGKLEFLEVPEDNRIGIFKTEFDNGSKQK